MSSITSPSRVSKAGGGTGDAETTTLAASERTGPAGGGGGKAGAGAAPGELQAGKLEARLNIKDLEALQDAFLAEGDGYDNRLSLTRDQFCEALSLILNKGTREEFTELFDKIDIQKEGVVDWDKLASHMLLEFYEKDDRVKGATVPQWKDLKNLPSPHKDVIQRVGYLKNLSRYVGISREGAVSMWDSKLRLARTLRAGTDTCRARDLWVTNFVLLYNINKIALGFTSKEILLYDLSSKLEFNCQYKLHGLPHTPLSLDYWANPDNTNEAVLCWGDTGGRVNALHFTSANIALFERPPAPAGEKVEPCLNVKLDQVIRGKYKNARYLKHMGHTEWVRHVLYSAHLECIISCSTTWANSVVIGWMEKSGGNNQEMKTTVFQISQGVNAFDYHEQLNVIATAGVNHHVCLWNPYVVSKPTGVLRGHMAAVVQCQFNKPRGQLISFSKDKVLRIWDVQLQVCIQRLAGMFPKGPEVHSYLYFDEATSRLFITFNYQLTVMEMKPEIKDRIMSHDKPLVGAFYNSFYNQVVSACQGGNVVIWMVDTGQKVKQFSNTHGAAELTCLAQDSTETRLYTGSVDGTVKVWDFNGHCYHTLHCGRDGQQADVGQVLVLKHSILAVGWSKYITVFRNQSLRDYNVEASEWKGGEEHTDDILALTFLGPNTLASASYDGEIVLWNNNSEQASRRLMQRCRKPPAKSVTRENTTHTGGEGGYDSHSYKPPERARSRPKSRAASRVSEGSHDEGNDYGYAIARMLFIQSRKGNTSGANLITCGGNGWVRWWSSVSSSLLAEYAAHEHVGSIIMALDRDDTYMVTGDVNGLVKVWAIHDYLLETPADGTILTTPPTLISQFQPHLDMINSLDMCERNERTLILSASSDCSVTLWDIYGNQIGTFGQEEHWKIEPYVPQDDAAEAEAEAGEEEELTVSGPDADWRPDSGATADPANYSVNVWQTTVLGKGYQESRVKKRQRRQPGTIPDLPYLHWERTGAPPAGPAAALNIANLDENIGPLQKPDFMYNPHKYFAEKIAGDSEESTRLPVLAETLKTAFDEKTLFPKSMLDFEARMKSYHSRMLENTQKKAGQNFIKSVKVGDGAAPGGQQTARQSASPKKAGKRQQQQQPQQLKPINA